MMFTLSMFLLVIILKNRINIMSSFKFSKLRHCRINTIIYMQLFRRLNKPANITKFTYKNRPQNRTNTRNCSNWRINFLISSLILVSHSLTLLLINLICSINNFSLNFSASTPSHQFELN